MNSGKHVEHVKKGRQISRQQKHDHDDVKPVPTTFSPKKKSPSRRRRDRERFRKFLEQKKKRKQTANSPQQSHSQDSQLSLNSNTTHPSQSRRPLSDIACEEVKEILASPSPENFSGPFLEQHYDNCTCAACTSEPSYDTMAGIFCDLRNCCYWCGAPPGDVAGGLKKCTQCKCVAYCSKPCQFADWKQRHKEQCKLNVEATHRAVELQWNIVNRHTARTVKLAAYSSRIRENSLLISPYVGIISRT